MADVSAAFSFLTLSISFIAVLSVIFCFSSSRLRRPTKAPCPQSYPIVGNLPGFLRNRHRFHDWVADMLSLTPSSTLQVNSFLGLSHGVCTANPLNMEHILLSNFPNYVKGSRFRNVLHELLGDGIFSADGHLWTIQRKIASYEFNTKSLKHFISQVVSSEISKNLLPYLSTACDENRIVDLQAILQRFTFNNICNVAFGLDTASLNDESDFVKAFDGAVELCSSRFLSPVPAIWKFKRFLNIGSEKRFKGAMKLINKYAMDIIKHKEEQQIKGNIDEIHDNHDLLSRFMSASSKMEFQDHDQKRKFLRDIVVSFILAGKDSTSTVLTWFFWLINGNPRCANMIRDELATLSSSEIGPGPGPGALMMAYDGLKKLHYLHAALSETIRLFPPVPINSRVTVGDDVLPDGTHVGKGWFADYSAYAMGRMEKVWGKDCKEFKPERWLDGDGVFQPSDQFRFPAFHCGPRMCLGKEMAYVQMKSIVAALMTEFEIIAVDGGASPQKMMDPPYTLSLLLKMKGGLPVRIKRRQASLST